jgi:ribosome biogenesis protein UTP30
MLPRLLGKSFYASKKAPLAVDFTRAGWPEQVRKVISSTFLYMRTGSCSGIKVGRLDMEEDEIVENVMAAVEAAVEKVPKNWANVRALHLKAVDSVALPIYQAVPEIGLKIEVPRRLEGEIGTGEVIDSGEVETGKKRKDKKMKALKNASGAKEETVKNKRKRNKKDQTEDVVMGDVQEVSEKRRKKEDVPAVEVTADDVLKVAKKGKDKKRALDTDVEDASPAEKKGRKGERASQEAGNKKKQSKIEDTKQAPEEVKDVDGKKNKDKKGDAKEGKKKSKKVDDGEIVVDGESIPDTKEEEKSIGKKSSGMKKRTRARASCC